MHKRTLPDLRLRRHKKKEAQRIPNSKNLGVAKREAQRGVKIADHSFRATSESSRFLEIPRHHSRHLRKRKR